MIRTFMWCNHVGHIIKIIRPIVVNQKFVRIREYSVKIPRLNKESEPTNKTAGNTCLKDNPFFHTIKFSKYDQYHKFSLKAASNLSALKNSTLRLHFGIVTNQHKRCSKSLFDLLCGVGHN